jgi:hypothetical protein
VADRTETRRPCAAGDAGLDPARPERSAVDESGVRLEQRGAGQDPLPRVVGGLDAAGGDEQQAVAGPGPQPPQHAQRLVPHRRAGQAARPGGADLFLGAGQVIAGHGCVRGDDAGQPELHGQVGDRVDVLVGQIGRDLDQQRKRRPAGGPGQSVANGGEHLAQPAGGLQIAQPGGVRRAHVHHEVVGRAGQQPCALGVVGGGRGFRHHLGLADVRADRQAVGAAGAAGAQAGRGRGGAVVVEPHPVDQRPVGGQPEQPGPRVARLRPGGHGAHLDEREAERTERVWGQRILVEARGQPERPGQIAPECVHPQRRIGRAEPPAQEPGRSRDRRGRADDPEAQPVRGLGRHPPEHQPEQQVVHALSLAAGPDRPARGAPQQSPRARTPAAPAGRRVSSRSRRSGPAGRRG